MTREGLLDNEIGSLNGADWSSRGSDEVARQAISQMLEGLGSNGAWPTDVPVMAFRKSRLLGMLNVKFEGDIPRALRFARPDLFGKPLLNLGEFRPNDPLRNEWKQREQEIDAEISATMFKRSRRFHWVFKGRMIDEKEAEELKKYPRYKPQVRQRSANERERVRKDISEWRGQENQDLKTAITRFVRPGDTVCALLSGHDGVIPSLILSKLGEAGRLYVVTPGPYLINGLSEAFSKMFLDLSEVKGEEHPRRTKHEKKVATATRRVTGASLIDQGFSHKMRGILSALLRRPDEDFYFSGLDYIGNGYIERLFDHLHLLPLRYFPPEMPKEIPSKSVNIVFEADRFNYIPEQDQESALYEMDRVLKPGGLMIVREDSVQQAAIEYYGQEVFSQKYQRWQAPREIGYRSRWMIFHKSETSPSSYPERVNKYQEDSTTAKDKLPRRRDLVRAIRQAETEVISLTWLRTRGLLPILMAEFGGNVDQAIAAALQVNTATPNESAGEISMVTGASVPVTPKDAKTSYSIEDLSKELNLSRSKVRAAIGNLDIKVLGDPTGRAGHSGFTRRAVESRQIHLSYQEYMVVRDAIKRQNLKTETSTKKGDNNGT